MLDRQVDGLIWIAPRVGREILEATAARIPTVLVAYHDRDATEFDTANAKDEEGARLAVEHLCEQGYRNIAMVSVHWSDTGGAVPHHRERGYLAAMAKHELERHAGVLYSEESAVDLGPSTVAMLRQPDRPDAVFCWNDFAALQILSEAKRAGLDVPGQLAMVGIDNMAFCNLQQNSLSSVDQSAEALGEHAARMLFERIEGREQPRHILLEPRLVVRGSSV